MDMMHEQHNGCLPPHYQWREERDSVLAVDDAVDPGSMPQQPPQDGRVDGESSATADDSVAVNGLLRGRSARTRRDKDDGMPVRGEFSCHLLAVQFCTAGLRMPGITPVQDRDPHATAGPFVGRPGDMAAC